MDYRAQPGPEYYKSHKEDKLEDKHTIQRVKFGEKALIWQTIFICGQQENVFRRIGLTKTYAISRKEPITLINFNYFATIGINVLLYPYVVTPDLLTFSLFSLEILYQLPVFYLPGPKNPIIYEISITS